MKITKKDKTVLLLLVFGLVVVIFIMYGISPVNKELKEKQTAYDALKKEVDALVQEYNNPAAKPEAVEDKIEQMLMDYYLKDSVGIMAKNESEAKIFFAEAVDYAKEHNTIEDLIISNFLPADGSNIAVTIVSEKNPNDTSIESTQGINLMHTSQVYTYTSKTLYGMSYVLDFLNKNEDLLYKNLTIDYDESSDEYVLKVMIYNYYLMAPEKLPLPLVDDVASMNLMDVKDAPGYPTEINQTEKYIKFDAIAHAEYYEIYEVIDVKENGSHKEYKYVKVQSNIESDNNIDVKFYYEGKLQHGKSYVVTAMGNYKDAEAIKSGKQLYYRTILSEYLANNAFSIPN